MCSQFLKKMEGDLADIVRATATNGRAAAEVATWQFPTNTIQYPSDPVEDFGDPFTYTMRDPLMQNSGFSFYNSKMVAPPLCDSRAAAAVVAPPSGVKGPIPVLVPNNLQISSPRNTGLKRRKSQAKKVVCIPAPAPANSRSTGEVVPSDLWAWRKYGQKPIKGSPYPRGYYRCSSSKGCPARKQVERSRTDPNMLVITYTSEHNHPWPTQRNALAGSTRSQPSKNTQKPDKESRPLMDALVKQETDQDFDNQFELMDEIEVDPETYKPTYEDSFFADLGEIELADSLLFTEGFSNSDPGRVSADLDPFSFYDWANNGGAATSTTGESKMGS